MIRQLAEYGPIIFHAYLLVSPVASHLMIPGFGLTYSNFKPTFCPFFGAQVFVAASSLVRATATLVRDYFDPPR